MPIGSWLLWATTLLLLGGFGHVPALGRRLLLSLLSATLGLHLLASFWPVLIWAALGTFALTAFAIAWERLSSLTVAASLATTAVLVLSWPAAVASGLDPVVTAGIGVGLMAAVTSPGMAAPAAALLGALFGYLTLGHSFSGPATFAPNTEQFFQVAATAAAVSAASALLIEQAWALRGRLAR